MFPDEKLAKQVLNSAKRFSNPRKRPTSDAGLKSPTSKRASRVPVAGARDLADTEAELALPGISMTEDGLRNVTLQTNRAPLVLAFAVTLLKYTMPEQPLSSRLSLAQAVVSANSRSKAQAIGLEIGKSAEDEGWGRGQQKAKVMGREIAVMRRASYVPTGKEDGWNDDEIDSQAPVEGDRGPADNSKPAFWGLDLEALRKSNGPLIAGKNANGQPKLPIYTAQAARSYLLKSFTAIVSEVDDAPHSGSPAGSASSKKQSPMAKKKLTPAQLMGMQEEAAAMLLAALELLYLSWATVLSRDELDGRAWSWYLHVRPDIAQGAAGWGQKGSVQLGDILDLKRVN